MSVQIKGVGTIGGIDQGLNTVGVITATSFVGSGANLTSLPSQVSISNNSNDRVITGGSGVNLNGEANLVFTGSRLGINPSSGTITDIPLTSHDTVVIGNSSATAGGITLEGSSSSGNLAFQMYKQGNQPCARFMYEFSSNSVRFDSATGSSPGGGEALRMRLHPDGDVEIADGNLILANGHGIDFSATANSSGTMENELLDDYEEGSWVPVYNNVNTPNYGHRSGRYTKIGRFVYLVCQISVDSGLDTSDGSTVNIGGFPFTGNNAHGSCLFTLGQYIDVMPDSTIDLFTNVRFLGNAVLLHEGRNNQDITYTQLNSSGNLQFACSYAL